MNLFINKFWNLKIKKKKKKVWLVGDFRNKKFLLWSKSLSGFPFTNLSLIYSLLQQMFFNCIRYFVENIV